MKPCGYGVVCLLVLTQCASAQYVWDGGAGADDSWGNPANWVSPSVPPTGYTGRIVFTNLDLGNINRIESNRTITGSSASTTEGLHYNINGQNGAQWHTTDLNGRTLTLNGGTLLVGFNSSNSLVRIQNGTLKIGAANRPDVLVGYMTVAKACSNASLVVSATIQATNCGNIHVGRQTYGNDPSSVFTPQGTLDLSGATIHRGSVLNTLYLFGTLSMGMSGGGMAGPNPFGIVKLPSSLRQLDVQHLYIGYERDGYGTLDFGAGSGLTNFTVRGNFYMASYSARGRILNLPSNVAWCVGSPGAPSTMILGSFQYDSQASRWDITASLAPIGGVFLAYLSQLTIGQHLGGNQGTVSGTLDLSKTAIRFNDTPNSLRAGSLNIGSKAFPVVAGAAGLGDGYLKLAPTVTNIMANNLALGLCNNTRGRLDIGAASQLRNLVVSNGFYIGVHGSIGYDNAGTFRWHLPAGIRVEVGSYVRYAQMQVGCRGANQYASYTETYGSGRGVFRITNGTFDAYLSELRVGTKEDSAKVVTGIVDLASANVGTCDIRGNVYVGAQTYVNVGNQNGKGYVYFPACTVNVASNLYVGDTNEASSFGLLSLNGTRARVGARIEIQTTGVVTTRVNGAAAGLEFTGSDTNQFYVAPAGRIYVKFTADPVDSQEDCWGICVAGNNTNFIASLLEPPTRLFWNYSGLSGMYRERFGVWYNAKKNYSFLGVKGYPTGTVLTTR